MRLQQRDGIGRLRQLGIVGAHPDDGHIFIAACLVDLHVECRERPVPTDLCLAYAASGF